MIFAFSAFLVFLAIGTPIVFVLGIAATLTLMLTQPDIPLTIVTQRIYDGPPSRWKRPIWWRW